MKTEIIYDTFDITTYNAAANHPLQAWEWGEARKETGVGCVRFGEFNTSLEHVYQMTVHPIPHTRFKIGYLPRSVWPSDETLKVLFEYGQKNNLLFIKLEPDILKDNSPSTHTNIKSLKRSPHPLFPQWTMILNLQKTEAELLQSMKSKTRYNIRLAQKKGVVIKKMDNEQGFAIFSQLYFETCKRQKYFGHTAEYHHTIWKHLQNKIAHILVAFYENIPLAAYELFYFHNTLYYPYGGSSLQYRNLMGANLLMWEAIELGLSLGATSFDMWGALSPDYTEDNPWAGFTRFKEGYGAVFTEMVGSYDLVINPLLYPTYTALHTLRSLFLAART